MRKMVELNRTGMNENVDSVTLTHNQTFIHSFGGLSYLSGLESYANLEKCQELEKLIFDLWKETTAQLDLVYMGSI
jgi:replicative DNA helicase